MLRNKGTVDLDYWESEGDGTQLHGNAEIKISERVNLVYHKLFEC